MLSRLRIMMLPAILVLWGIVVMQYFWTGPHGKDGILYADPALLSEPRNDIAIRYLHVYAIAAAGDLAHSIPLGAGAWALIGYLIAVGVVTRTGFEFGRLAGLLAGMLAATCPLFLGTATVPLADLSSTAFAFAALCALWRAEQSGLRWACYAGVLLLVATRSKETALCVVPAMAAIVAALERRLRLRTVAWVAAGFGLAFLAASRLDASIVGDPFWMLRRQAGSSYLAFNLRATYETGGDANLIDNLSNRWVFPYALLCAVAAATFRNHRVGLPLIVFAATSAAFMSFAVSIADFGANDRYAMPILLPLFPVAGAWVEERAREAESGITQLESSECLLLLLVLVASVVLSQTLTSHFVRRAFNQLLPTLWALAVAATMASTQSRRGRALIGTALLGLLGASTIASLYSARQMSLHARQNNAQWQALVSTLAGAQGEVIGVAASDEIPLERTVRVHSGSAQWRLRRLRAEDEWPRLVIADSEHASLAAGRGYKRIASFDPLPLVLLGTAQTASSGGMRRPISSPRSFQFRQ